MFDTRSDQERQEEAVTVRRPTLSPCAHKWGLWMRDAIKIDGMFFATSPTAYRRFCHCGAEQKGHGTSYGNNIEVTK